MLSSSRGGLRLTRGPRDKFLNRNSPGVPNPSCRATDEFDSYVALQIIYLPFYPPRVYYTKIDDWSGASYVDVATDNGCRPGPSGDARP